MTPQYIEIDEFGSKFHYKDKEMEILHREDGPAVEWADGDKSWYLNGEKLTEKEFSNLHNSEKERKIYQFGLGVMNILYNHQEDRLSRQLERIRNAAIDLRVMDWDEKGNFNKL